MAPRILLALLALALAGDSAPEKDPFLAALAGKSGKDAVAAPDFDPDLAAVSWSLRPRREIVDALAARLLRGEAGAWYEPAKEVPSLPGPPSRIPADFEPGSSRVVDRLAARVPADAAVVFFDSLSEAHDAVGELSRFLPRILPGLCRESPEGSREALRRAIDMLLLPTIWRSNPEVRTGTRQVALVVSDPDLRWAPDIALVCEVEDASLVLAHRKATFSWEERGSRRIRVDGLDAVSDDGSIRSYFALEDGIALWSTTASLRGRVLAASAAKSPSLLSGSSRDYALARGTFPRVDVESLLVVPDAFLARVGSPAVRVRRAAALRCEAARRLLEARMRAGSKDPRNDTVRLSCPSGGDLRTGASPAGPSCSVHGTAEQPTPYGDVARAAITAADRAALNGLAAAPDLIQKGAISPAMLWDNALFHAWIPIGAPGRATYEVICDVDSNRGKCDEVDLPLLWKFEGNVVRLKAPLAGLGVGR